MALPPRASWPLQDLANRWDCLRSDIVQWALTDHIQISAVIDPTLCDGETLIGLVSICAVCLTPMFLANRERSTPCRVRRIAPPGSSEWRHVVAPPEGILLDAHELIVTSSEVARFEEEYEVLRRANGSSGTGTRYDWEGMLAHLALQIFRRTVPETQGELVAEMQQWFIDRSPNAEAPDERSIRRRITPLWQAMHERA